MEATTAVRASATCRCWSAEGRVWESAEVEGAVVATVEGAVGARGGKSWWRGDETEVAVDGGARWLEMLGWWDAGITEDDEVDGGGWLDDEDASADMMSAL